MKQQGKIIVFVMAAVLALLLYSCGDSGNSGKSKAQTSSSGSTHASSDSYTYNSGKSSSYSSSKSNDYGYSDPKPGESFSDYLKREDPELYADITGRYDSLK